MTSPVKPVRVLQVLTCLNPGGIENYLMNLYRNMNRNEVQFDFLVHRSHEGVYEKEVKSLGANIYRVSRANPLNPRYFAELKLFFDQHSYDVIHVNLDCMSAFVLAAAKKHGVETRIAHSHSSSQDKDIKYPIKLLSKRLIPKYATDLFACGERAGQWMFDGARFSIKPNAVELKKFEYRQMWREEIKNEFNIPQSAFVVGHVGRFNKVKNQTFLLEVLKELTGSSVDAYLLFVGDGEERKQVAARAEQMGLTDRVRFTGIRNDVNRCMSAFDVFAMPSLYEGLPLVLIEAQANGLRCIINETLPSDCDLTDLMLRLPLRAEEWSRLLQKLATRKAENRRSRTAELKKEGFEIEEEAKKMQGFYLERAIKAGAA